MKEVNGVMEVIQEARHTYYRIVDEVLGDEYAPHYQHVYELNEALLDAVVELEQTPEVQERGIKALFKTVMMENSGPSDLEHEVIYKINKLLCCLKCALPQEYLYKPGYSCTNCIYGTYVKDFGVNDDGELVRVHVFDQDYLEDGAYKHVNIEIAEHSGKKYGISRITRKGRSGVEVDVPINEIISLIESDNAY